MKERLEQLNIEFQMLEDLIAKGKTLTIEENDDDEDDESGEITIHCVTCGANIQANTAIRHMERCYNKVSRVGRVMLSNILILQDVIYSFSLQFESQTSFASKFKTQIEDHRMFCDFYNPKEQSYCKRLQVLCPEHNQDPKIADDEVSKNYCVLVFSPSDQFDEYFNFNRFAVTPCKKISSLNHLVSA